MTDILTTTSPVITVNGTPLDQTWCDGLIELRIERAFQVPSRLTMRFNDPIYELLSSKKMKLGTELAVSVQGQGGLVVAEVTGMSVEQAPTQPPELVVVAHDRAHRLGRENKVATFQKMHYSAIVSQLASAAGLSASVDATSRQLDYMLQVESSLALITELANRIGYDWWVEDKTLHFKKPSGETAAVVLTADDDLLSFSVKASGHRPDTVTVRGWNHTEQAAIVGNSDPPTLNPDSDFAKLVASPGKAFGQAKLLSANLAAASTEEAKELSNALLQSSVTSSVVAKGVAHGNAKIKLGVPVQITGFGPLSGKYHVSEVEHVFRPSGFRTRFVAGDRHPTTLVDTLANGAGYGNPMLGNLEHRGLVVGQVTNIADPDSKGRIRVRFTGLSDEDESGWARLVSIGGGQKRGMVFIPEVGDEVVVGFENGDVRQPVVFGGLFGAKLEIPKWDVADGKVTARRITSRDGHYVELSDGESDASKHILLALAAAGYKLRLGEDRFDLALPQGKPALIQIGEAKIEVTNSGDINIEATNINIKAKAKVAISGAQIEVKGTASVAVEANGQTSVKGGVVEVNATGTAMIKGTTAVMIN
ncbi:MAG TPA: VgrG-related protein [Acidimicrobiales bacterium]|jgi:phage protein D/phage baseplate assembly protein gpV